MKHDILEPVPIDAPNHFRNKWVELAELPTFSQIQLTTGEIGTFVKLNKTKFICTMDGKSYSIPIAAFDKVIEKPEENKGYLKLKKGDLFCILYRNDAVLYEFAEIKDNKIIGINPITKSTTRIDPDLFVKKL